MRHVVDGFPWGDVGSGTVVETAHLEAGRIVNHERQHTQRQDLLVVYI